MNRFRCLLTALLLLCIAPAIAQEVTFSTPGGFYETPFELTLSCEQPDKVIHFTTNGNSPTVADPIYATPLLLDENLYSRSNIFTIQNSPDEHWYQPESIQKCIVIRAAAFDEAGVQVGQVATHTYLIKSLGCDTHGLPVLSLCADSLDLFDYESGIFIPGAHYNPEAPLYSGNYFQTGKEWERNCNVEFYESGNKGINQRAGLRTQGLSTRRFPQKGLKIYAREEYGKKRFNYRFFDDTFVESFKHLKIKPFQAGWETRGCEDHISGRIARHLDLDCLASRPMVLYINGEYWGIYFLQEKPDERYIEDHYDLDLNTINIIESWNGAHCEYGTGEAMIDLHEWIKEHDLDDEENYRYVAERIDINNFIDYEAFEIFSANLDWPANNVRSWNTNGNRWRWLFYDGDASLFRPMREFDAIDNATYDGEGNYPSNRVATLLFRKLLENNTFKTQFLSRFYQLLSTVFRYEATKPIYDETFAQLYEEITNQSNRFGKPVSKEDWKTRMETVDLFLSQRVQDVDIALREHFLDNDTELEMIDVYQSSDEDRIHITIEAKETLKAHLQVFDMTGRRITSNEQIIGAGITEIELPSPSASGLYLVKCNEKVKKLVVSH